MGSETRFHKALIMQEGALKVRLVELLTRTLAGEKLALFDRSQKHFLTPPNSTDPVTLEDLGAGVIDMRTKLGVPLDHGFWAEYLGYCERAKQMGMQAEHELAKEFLKSLEAA